MCSVLALQKYMSAHPVHPKQPFRTLGNPTSIMTQAMARQVLAQVLWALNLNPSHYSFHTSWHSTLSATFRPTALGRNKQCGPTRISLHIGGSICFLCIYFPPASTITIRIGAIFDLYLDIFIWNIRG